MSYDMKSGLSNLKKARRKKKLSKLSSSKAYKSKNMDQSMESLAQSSFSKGDVERKNVSTDLLKGVKPSKKKLSIRKQIRGPV